LLDEYCCMWTPPMLCVPPSFLQIPVHMPIIGLPRLGWCFPTSHISLRVKRNAHIESYPQGVLYARLKSGGEPRIPIRDNGYRNPMEPYHIVYVNLGKLVYRIGYLYGLE
jgi:hypothetical protein